MEQTLDNAEKRCEKIGRKIFPEELRGASVFPAMMRSNTEGDYYVEFRVKFPERD